MPTRLSTEYFSTSSTILTSRATTPQVPSTISTPLTSEDTTPQVTSPITSAQDGYAVFRANGMFQVPVGMRRVRVLVVGGGSGGLSGIGGAGSSGYVSSGEYDVTPGVPVPVTVGTGGDGSS